MDYVTLLYILLLLGSSLVLALDDYDFDKEKNKPISVDSLLAYNKWKFHNKRNYLSEEEENFRQFIFFENYKKIQKHNRDANATYKMDVDQFSDMSQEEFESKMLNKEIMSTYKTYHINEDDNEASSETDKRKLLDLPSSIDWRAKGAVTRVKNQGHCGSCWAFSAIGVLEGVNFLRNQPLTSFSEQQLLDCCTNCGGCTGAWPAQGLEYVKKYGALKESAYPYIGTKSACKVNAPTSGVYISSYKSVSKSIDALKFAVSIQPVSIAVHAGTWLGYRSGVFNSCSSDPAKVDHGALLVGYTAKGEWIVKNSWGPLWGNNGYITLAPRNTCGIYNYGLVIAI